MRRYKLQFQAAQQRMNHYFDLYEATINSGILLGKAVY